MLTMRSGDAVSARFIHGELLGVQVADRFQAALFVVAESCLGLRLFQLEIHGAEVAFEIAELLADGLADFLHSGLLLLGHGEVLLSRFLPAGAGFGGFSGKGGMELVDVALGLLAGFVEQLEVGGIGDVRGRAGRIDQELAFVGGRFLVLLLPAILALCLFGIGARGCGADDFAVDALIVLLPKPAAEMHHHRRVKQGFLAVFVPPEKILPAGVLGDLFHGFLVGDAQAFLDDEGSKGDPGGLRRSSHSRPGEAPSVACLDLAPGDHGRQFHPTVGGQ